MTLTQALGAQQSLQKQALMVLVGTIAIAIAAQVSVPMYPVPMTLQTLAVLLVGLILGARLGAITVLTYLAEGALGLPVFANLQNGAAFFGPTAGFLVGFIGVAWLAGFAADRGWTRNLVLSALLCVVASLFVYIPGAAWPMAFAGMLGLDAGWVGLSASQVWAGFAAPFLMGDVLKACLAAVIAAGAGKALKLL